jgi:hypothetical protein
MKIAASVLLAIPAILLLAIALGEMASGEMSGAQHLPEGGLLLLVALAGWKYPRAVGAFVLAAGVAVCAAWVGFVVTGEDVGGRAPLLVWVGVGLVLFAPPIVAGWLLWRAGGRAGTLLLR